MQSDLQLRLRGLLLQERIRRRQFLVGLIAQSGNLVWLDNRGHGQDTDWHAKYLDIGVETGSGDGDFIRVLDVGALVRRGTRQRKGFFEQVWNENVY